MELGCRRELDFSVSHFLYHLGFVLCIYIINYKVIVYSLACQKAL